MTILHIPCVANTAQVNIPECCRLCAINLKNKVRKFYVAFTVHFCLIEQFIPTNAHRHTMSMVSFIYSLPQYVFRRAYIAIFRGSLKFFSIDQYL
jgi:hypothetical protein